MPRSASAHASSGQGVRNLLDLTHELGIPGSDCAYARYDQGMRSLQRQVFLTTIVSAHICNGFHIGIFIVGRIFILNYIFHIEEL